jgi:hypothetical protein
MTLMLLIFLKIGLVNPQAAETLVQELCSNENRPRILRRHRNETTTSNVNIAHNSMLFLI